jgi:hypothetical protein
MLKIQTYTMQQDAAIYFYYVWNVLLLDNLTLAILISENIADSKAKH